MLKQLSIQNVAVAENISVDFDNGLNIITGETGAGKSILVDALALLRGGKVDASLIRDGTESALVAAVFYVLPSARVIKLLCEMGIATNPDDAREIALRRVLTRTGKHRAFVNDVPVNSKTLQVIASELIDISSQFDNQRLLETESHTRYLDQFVDALNLALQYVRKYEGSLGLLDQVRTLELEIALRKRELSLYAFELRQIEESQLAEADFFKVTNLVQLGNKSESAKRLCADMANLLSEGDHNLLSSLRFCKKNVEKLQRLAGAKKLSLSIEQVDEAVAHVESLLESVEATQAEFDIDDEKFAMACERLEIYNRILQKFGPELNDVFLYRDKCAGYLNQSSDLEERHKVLVQKAATSMTEAVTLADTLSKKRADGVKALATCIQRELGELGMPKARFICSIVANEHPVQSQALPQAVASMLPVPVVASFLRLGRLGAEHAQFLMSANAGLEPQPIEKVASGGELSRTMLAIKSVLFENDAMSVFVFDEIDTGISGNIAAKVGKKLAEFCITRQAICITHLPQVACFSCSHFIVSKSVRKNRTVAAIKRATNEEKLKELAGMLSGEKVTPESIAHARSLVLEARGVLQ